MSSLRIPLDDLYAAAREFQQAAGETAALRARLQKRMDSLDEAWNEAAKQMFFRYYAEWKDETDNFAEVLSLIAAELKAVADRYSRISQ